MSHRLIRLGGLFGVLFLVEVIWTGLVMHTPPADATPAEMLRLMTDTNYSGYFFDTHASVLAGACLFVFWGVLRLAWKRSENVGAAAEKLGPWPWVADASVVVYTVMAFAATLLWEAYTDALHGFSQFGTTPQDAGIAYVLFTAGNWFTNYGSVMFGAAAICVAIISIRTGVVVKWIGWVTLVLGIVSIVGYFNSNAFTVSLLWISVMGLLMLIVPGHVVKPHREAVLENGFRTGRTA